ncbi:MAG: polysaccharide biosynthesis C-terminal domain-containing protein, partial [Lentisphaeria bacterium]|nr:polysaccharide biosynthesis C-terminal domain-containing protein [Lentisphaeria bacterium]
MKTASYQIDMCHGALLPKIILFAMPLIFTSMMQLLFNALDLVVIGHYSTHQSMAAIGSTANLIALLINSFSGLAIGTNVLAARYFGAKDEKNLQLTVHTSIAAAFYCGALVTVFGMLAAEPILRLMDTPEDVLPLSCRYVRIFFFSVPAVLLFNFGSAVMRSAGDTRRPMYYLLIAGVIKVALNLSFVVGLGWDIGGVAAATAISHGLAAMLVLRALLKAEDS